MTGLDTPPPGEFLLYETEDGRTRVECRFVADTLWLPQAGMAELFQTSKQNIAKHLKAIFSEGELDASSVVNQWLTTAADGKKYRVAHYSLEVILAVGYRVRSSRGTQFGAGPPNERDVLDDGGRISKKQADAHADIQYEKFAARRRALLEVEGAENTMRTLEDAATYRTT